MTTAAEPQKAANTIRPKRFRVADFCRMTEIGILPEESGWEVIDGFLIDKMTIGSRRASVVRRLEKFFERAVGDQVIVSGQNPVQIDDYDAPEPDVALLAPRADFYAASHPAPADVLLLVEVSDSTVEYDRDIKKTLYAEAEIQEFWLVNLKDNNVEVYTQPKNGAFHLARILEAGETIESATIENLRLSVEEILGT